MLKIGQRGPSGFIPSKRRGRRMRKRGGKEKRRKKNHAAYRGDRCIRKRRRRNSSNNSSNSSCSRSSNSSCSRNGNSSSRRSNNYNSTRGERLKEQLDQCWQQELQELQQQQQQQQLEAMLEQQPQSPHQPQSLPSQGLETGEEELPVYGPPTPAWLHPGGLASIPAEPGREDGVVALACAMRTPADPQPGIKGTIYGIEGITLGFLWDRRPWEDLSADGGDEAGTSGGGDAGTWSSVDNDGRFPSIVDLFLRHGGSLETIQELIRGVKVRTEEEMENWGPGRIRLRASTCPEEPNIMMDDQEEAKKWEHLEELQLWMKHVVGLMSDIINNGLDQAFFVSTFGPLLFGSLVSYSYCFATCCRI